MAALLWIQQPTDPREQELWRSGTVNRMGREADRACILRVSRNCLLRKSAIFHPQSFLIQVA